MKIFYFFQPTNCGKSRFLKLIISGNGCFFIMLCPLLLWAWTQCGHTKQKGRFCIAAKTSFFVVSNEKNADIA